MESLPNEILLKICKHLSAQDCCRLASTCSRLYNIQPALIAHFNICQLVIRTEAECPPTDFVKRNLSSSIAQIRVNVDDFGLTFAQKLREIVEACPNLQVLKLDSVASTKQSAIVDLLNEFVPKSSIKEFHGGFLAGHIVLPSTIEKCTLPASYFRHSRSLEKEAREQRLRVMVSSWKR